jgi:hypothetical protein
MGGNFRVKATVMHAAGDVRIENLPDATIINPTDAVITVTRACIWQRSLAIQVDGAK